jgi:hypothetical protein
MIAGRCRRVAKPGESHTKAPAYAQTPGRFAVEFGRGHRRLDDATHQPIIYPSGTPVDVWAATSKAQSSSSVNSERTTRERRRN